MIILAKSFGWLTAHSPRFVSATLAALLAHVIFHAFPARKRLLLSNLHHAFPDMPRSWMTRTAVNSCRQRVENRLLALALPYFSERRLRSMIHLTSQGKELLLDLLHAGRPTVLAIPQIGAWELATALPLLCPGHRVHFGLPYPGVDHPKLDRWLRRGRSRSGVRILTPENGMLEGLSLLKENGLFGILFDQWHTIRGIQALLLNRLTTVSELPGILVERFQPRLVGLYTERISFWHYAIRLKEMEPPRRAIDVAADLNAWLEKLLRTSDSACGSWPWATDRWKPHPSPQNALSLDRRRPLAHARTELPRAWRIWIRLPEPLGDTLKAIPLIRAIRQSRPDAALTFLGRQPVLDLLRPSRLCESEIALDAHKVNLRRFVQLQIHHPDITLILDHNQRSDAEAWVTGSPCRLGMERPGQSRPLLTSVWTIPDTFDERKVHQSRLIESFLRFFGLEADPDFRPLTPPVASPPEPSPFAPGPVIGLLCDPPENPALEWPIENWRCLATDLMAEPLRPHLVFPGRRCPPGRMETLTGDLPPNRFTPPPDRMNLAAFASALSRCDLVIAQDDDGLHLANALGVPVIGLYGPSNPVRTGPIYRAPCRIVLPPGSRPTGGAPMSCLRPDSVLQAVRGHLRRSVAAA